MSKRLYAQRAAFAAIAIIGIGAMSGCAHQWESLIDGNLYTKAHINRYPVSITAVDGDYSTINPRRVDAGIRKLTVDAPPVAGFNQPVRKEFEFKVEKCVRYWLAAQRASSLTQDFVLVIDHAEPIAGCMPFGTPQQASLVAPADIAPPTPIATPKRP
jgi:hypothetical protein